MRRYNHKKIERKCQKIWAEEGIYKTGVSKTKKKCYALDMFPYPSGEGLHVGHPKGYIASDVYSRYKKMCGYNVLHPMGWDAFGLPAENYAIKNKIHPKISVAKNIKRFKTQLQKIGFNYDWDREINTTDPDYYKWTQWIFLKMFEAGLAYESHDPINWCPSCKTGLANEDLDGNRCERCGSVVEKRPMRQWRLRITDYAERLLKDLDGLEWPEHIKELQRNWIGKSEGLIFKAQVKDAQLFIETFSAHFEACYADTFVVIAPDHPLLEAIIEGVSNKNKIIDAAKKIKNKQIADKFNENKSVEGIFTGRFITDPLGNGDLPIWIASYAFSDYGTGIVKCSAHDKRDFEFAKKYNIKLKPVLFPEDPQLRKEVENLSICFTDMENGVLSEPKEFVGKKAGAVRDEIAQYVIDRGYARRASVYRLRDWVFSRQRYWGEPIPLIFCVECKKSMEISKLSTSYKLQATSFSKGELLNPGWIVIPEKDLPLKLPVVKYYEPTGTGESPLVGISKWVNTKCPKCGGSAKRETNTMPQWAGSCWYYLRYMDPRNKRALVNPAKEKYWSPVDVYVGGAEHATRHLIYARFWHKFLYDIGIVSCKEPFLRLKSQGLILGEDGRKMSKRWGNVINPDDVIERVGADTLRLYEMFMGPFEEGQTWSADGIAGPRRFLERVWELKLKTQNSNVKTTPQNLNQNLKLKFLVNRTIKKITEDIENFKFNTSVSALMVYANELEEEERLDKKFYEALLLLLAPFAPHITEELWHELGYRKSIHLAKWPTYDNSKIQQENIVVVQINGKIRADFKTTKGISEGEARRQAEGLPSVQKWLAGANIERVVYVQNRLINFVTNRA